MSVNEKNQIKSEGYEAAGKGKQAGDNPYTAAHHGDKFKEWLEGYKKARAEMGPGFKANNSSFKSGVARALETIQNQAISAGVKLENARAYTILRKIKDKDGTCWQLVEDSGIFLGQFYYGMSGCTEQTALKEAKEYAIALGYVEVKVI